jgi:hypothetical protein
MHRRRSQAAARIKCILTIASQIIDITIVAVIINITIVDETTSRVMKRTIWVDDSLQNEFGDPLSNLAHANNCCVQVKAL